jgi:hypothetical protein
LSTPRELAQFRLDEANYYKNLALPALSDSDLVAVGSTEPQTVHYRDSSGSVGTIKLSYNPDNNTSTCERWLVDTQGKATYEKCVLASQGKTPDLYSDPHRFTQIKAGSLSEMPSVTEAMTQEVTPASKTKPLTITDTFKRPPGEHVVTTTRIEQHGATDAQARLAQNQQEHTLQLPAEKVEAFKLDTTSTQLVDVVTVAQTRQGTQTAAPALEPSSTSYMQRQADGRTVAISIGQSDKGEPIWNRWMRSADDHKLLDAAAFDKQGAIGAGWNDLDAVALDQIFGHLDATSSQALGAVNQHSQEVFSRSVSAIEVSGDNLAAALKRFPNIEIITLTGEVSNEQLAALKDAPGLKRLDLSGCQGFTDEGLQALQNLTKLNTFCTKLIGLLNFLHAYIVKFRNAVQCLTLLHLVHVIINSIYFLNRRGDLRPQLIRTKHQDQQ